MTKLSDTHDQGEVYLIPASSAQARAWFLERWLPGTSQYHICQAWELTGPLSIPALTAAFQTLIARHESLRTGFAEEGGEPLQRIVDSFSWQPRHIDLTPVSAGAQTARLEVELMQALEEPFDLAAPPLLRLVVWSLSPDRHVLLLVVHHIVSDGWSQGVLLRELGLLYTCALRAEPPSLPPLPLQYADYALWQREMLATAAHEESLQSWQTRLSGLEPLELPTDRPRTPEVDYTGGLVEFTVQPALLASLKTFAHAHGVTLYMVLLAVMQVLLMRLSGQRDIAVGSPMAGRSRAELEGLVGFFVNTLVLRTRLDPDEPLNALLGRVREVALDAYGHAEVPLEELVRVLNPARDTSRHPLFQVMLALQNQLPAELVLEGLQILPVKVPRTTTKFDLGMTFMERDGSLEGALQYASALFDETTMRRWSQHYLTLLESAVRTPELAVGRLSLLTDEERTRQAAWNETASVLPEPHTLHGRFEAQARETPQAQAVIAEAGCLSYAALDARAEAVARGLRGLGVETGARVGVYLPRSLDLIVGVLGILKAGAAYVPLDPSFPQTRLQYMLEDAGLALVLVGDSPGAAPPFTNARCVPVATLEKTDGPLGWRRSEPCDPAYVIYTSGSTGQPKGVVISHGAIANHMGWMCRHFAFDADDRVLLKTSLSSDASVWELFAPLWSGGVLVVGGPEVQGDTLRIVNVVKEHEVTIVQMVPSLLSAMLAEHLLGDCASLRLVFAGGEALSAATAEAFHAQCKAELHNLYGPTEVSVDATSWRCAPGTPDPLPIGRPISNIEAWVLDEQREQLPEGIPGELYLGGAGLADGYLNRPEITTQRFVAHPFKPGARLYRTGDRVRWRPDGNLEFLGRMDAQVKLRGYRIEPGEIEAALLAEGAAQAAVILREDRAGDPRLVAYVAGSALEEHTLREALRQRLPEFMVPSAVVVLPAIPLTPNGKLDRKALPAPGPAHVSTQWQAPQTKTEEAVAALWCEILGVDRVGRDDDFFALGGHSLLIIRLLARLRAEWGVDLTPRDAFENPTPESLARLIDQNAAAHLRRRESRPQPREPGSLATASSAQQGLWFIERWQPGLALYHISEVWNLKGSLNENALHKALTLLMQRHDALRTSLREQDDTLLLEVSAVHEPSFEVEDLRAEPERTRPHRLQTALAQSSTQPFNLRQGPLWRARLWRCADNEYVFLFVIHHLVSDGWSQAVLHDELAQAYAAALQGARPRLRALPLTYADYAAWRASCSGTEDERSALGWWTRQLADLPRLELPCDHPWPVQPTFAGALLPFTLSEDTTNRVRQLAQATSSTPFMVLLTAFKLLLARYSGSTDIVVGTPVAGRDHADLQGMVGMFVNTLVLRTDLPVDGSFTTALGAVRATVLEAQAHADLPFDVLVRALNPTREAGRNPLFQVMFSCQRANGSGLSLSGLTATAREIPRALAKFDLALSLQEETREIRGAFDFSSELFDADTVARMAAHYEALLDSLLQSPDETTAQLALGSAESRGEILAWSMPVSPGLPGAGVAELFEAQARARPEAIALTSDEGHVTYAALEQAAEQLAHSLREQGVGHETRVALCAARSVDLVVGILAILKSGGAWVPLDPAWPDARLSQILALAGCPLVLTQSDKLARLQALHPRVFTCNAKPASPPGTHTSEIREARGGSLAYVMFTSGSTGVPKGVLIEQQSIVRLVRDQQYARFAPDEVFLLLSPIAFDASIFEMWGALLNGGRLVIHPEARVTAAGLEAVIREHGVTTLWLTAALFNAVIDERPAALKGLRQLLTGGEALSPSHVRKACTALPGTRLVNGYGPTETTTFASCHLIEPAASDGFAPIPIGRPLIHSECFVLDGCGQLAPVGVEGELCLGGAGLARGYLGDPELDARRFVAHPIRSGARVYRTGDRARWRPDGTLEFRGRRDDQVKLRGYRIEPGEISSVIASLPGVREAAVLVRPLESGEPALVAYVAGGELDVGGLRAALKTRLPDYMIPSRWQILDLLPMTANGKLDRASLLLPPAEGADFVTHDRRPAADMVERHLLGLWQTFLQRQDIDLDAAFLELGGHSLLAVRIIDAIEHAFGVRLPLDILWLDGGSIRGVARRLRDRSDPSPWPVLVPLRQSGDSPPLFCVHTIGGNLFHYFPLARALPQSVPVYGLQARGLEGLEKPRSSVAAIAADCVDALNQVWPDGPCRIVGYSSGGVVAWEIARQLEAKGRQVELLGLVDTYAPGIHRLPAGTGKSASGARRLHQGSGFTRALHGLCHWLGIQPPGGFPDVAAAHWWAHAAYRPEMYRGRVDLFLTEVSKREASDPNLGWASLTGGPFEAHLLPGDHAQIVKSPNVALLAERLAARLGALPVP